MWAVGTFGCMVCLSDGVAMGTGIIVLIVCVLLIDLIHSVRVW